MSFQKDIDNVIFVLSEHTRGPETAALVHGCVSRVIVCVHSIRIAKLRVVIALNLVVIV